VLERSPNQQGTTTRVTTISKSVVILMADDDADDRLLAKDALAETKLPGELHFVEDGEQLLDYLHRRGKFAPAPGSGPDSGRHASAPHASAPRPGLILLDLNMPKKDGREALREIKNNPELRKIPVVVLTTSKADIDIAQIYDLGANSFITKPVGFDSMVKIVEALGIYWFQIVERPGS
jgi:CheY-like chemotaxis protein